MAARLLVALLVAAVGVLPSARASAQQPPAAPPTGEATPTPGQPAAQPPAQPARVGKQKVLVLRTESTVVPDTARIAVTKDVHAQAMRYKQLDVVLSGADLVEEMFEFECTEAGVECLGRIGAKYGAQLVVYSEVVKNQAGQQLLSMRLIDVGQTRVAQTTHQPLDAVDKPEVAIARGLVVLLGPVDLPVEQAEVPGSLHVTLFGGGVALVYVDDKLVGRTSVSGLKVSLAPGPHTVRVVRAGFREWTGRVTVTSGATVDQSVMLEQLADVAPPGETGPGGKPVDRPITHRWWFWVGMAAVVGAGVAVAVSLTSTPDKATTGTAVFRMDHSEAYLDPIFAGAGGK